MAPRSLGPVVARRVAARRCLRLAGVLPPARQKPPIDPAVVHANQVEPCLRRAGRFAGWTGVEHAHNSMYGIFVGGQ